METLVNLLGEYLCIVNIPLGPLTVHYREYCATFPRIVCHECFVTGTCVVLCRLDSTVMVIARLFNCDIPNKCRSF